MALVVKNPTSGKASQHRRQETWIRSLSLENPLEDGTATDSSILAWRIPWTEQPGRLQSIRLQRVRHDQSDLACMHAPNTYSNTIHSFHLNWIISPLNLYSLILFYFCSIVFITTRNYIIFYFCIVCLPSLEYDLHEDGEFVSFTA